jgi:phage terminase small subunit
MFARHFALRGEIAPAYQEAFPEEAASHALAYKKGREILQSQGVKARARALRDEAALDVMTATRAIAAHFLDVLSAPRDIVQHRRGACRYCHGDGHRYQWREHEYLERLDEVEHHNKTKSRGAAEMMLPDPQGGFGYDEAAPPAPDCPNCKGRGVGYTYVKDTTELSPEEEAAFEGIEVSAQGLKAKYASKAEAAQALMKLYGLGAENIRVLFKDVDGGEAPAIPDDPVKAADMYRDFIAGRLTGPSDGG